MSDNASANPNAGGSGANPYPVPVPAGPSPDISPGDQKAREQQLQVEKRKQPGIGFPSAGKQRQLLVVRLNVAPSQAGDQGAVRDGLRRLCTLFANIDNGRKTMDVLDDSSGQVVPTNLRDRFLFSATVGFGQGFFDLLGIPKEKRPRKLKEMPDHTGLGDVTPYSLGQTDLILQLGSTDSFVNRWVLENALQPVDPGGQGAGDPPDIVSAVSGWATVTDVHAGFQRTDGRNLQAFNDGVSNPRALSPLFDDVVWTTEADEGTSLKDGTYMVFQKIVHDLDQWRELQVDEQQEWVGRSKGTGLLLGTFDTDQEDEGLADRMHSPDPAIRQQAFSQWKPLFDEQADPTGSFFDRKQDGSPAYHRVADRCPAWSHVRKANPRGADGTERKIIFRRGYPFMESGMDSKVRSGLLFVCFQRDLEARFEFIKKNWFGNGAFPTPLLRQFAPSELDARHRGGRLSAAELGALTADERKLLGLAKQEDFDNAKQNAGDPKTQQTGREGLAGPSEHGVTPTGEFLAIVPLGGGYYFVPPIPNQDISQIGQQFFV